MLLEEFRSTTHACVLKASCSGNAGRREASKEDLPGEDFALSGSGWVRFRVGVVTVVYGNKPRWEFHDV